MHSSGDNLWLCCVIAVSIILNDFMNCSAENATVDGISRHTFNGLRLTEIKVDGDRVDSSGPSRSFYTYLGNEGMGYFEAIAFCYSNKLETAILISPRDDEILLSFLISLEYSPYNTRPFWLTLNDIENEGTFIWQASVPLGQYVNWAPNSPANSPSANCVSAQQLGYAGSSQKFGWINLPCGTKWRPLCQGVGGWGYNDKSTSVEQN